MTYRKTLAVLALTTLLLPFGARAHELPADPQTLPEQLASCEFDLFRTQRSDGTYYAALGNEALTEQYYPLIFRQSFKRHNPLHSRRDEELARSLAPQMVDITLNLAYADALPSKSRHRARFTAVLSVLLSEVRPEVLRSVVGAEVRRVRRKTGLTPEIFGAGVLALSIIDLYDKVAWGPRYVVEVKLPQWQGSTGWSLDGIPLSQAQFDALSTEVSQSLAGLGADGKVALVSGPCLHSHPVVLESTAGAHTELEGGEPDATFDGDPITVIDDAPYTAEQIYERLRNLGRSPDGGTSGGGGGDPDEGGTGGSSSGEGGSDNGVSDEQRQLRRCQDQCLRRFENGFRGDMMRACEALGEFLQRASSRVPRYVRDLSPVFRIENCRGDGVVEGLLGRFNDCVEECRLDL